MKSLTEYCSASPKGAPVVGQHLVLVEERQHAGDHLLVLPDRQQLAFLSELLGDRVEEPPREDRRAERVHAVGVDVPEGVQVAAGRSRPGAHAWPLPRHPSLLARDGVQVLLVVARDRPRERHVERLGRQVDLLAGPVAQLHVARPRCASASSPRRLEQRRARPRVAARRSRRRPRTEPTPARGPRAARAPRRAAARPPRRPPRTAMR